MYIQTRHTIILLVWTADIKPIRMTTEILLLISNVLTGVAGFFVGKRRSDAETDNQVLRNLELSVNLYKQIIDDLKKEIHDLNIQVQLLEKKVEDLMAENKKLKKHNGL
jgi:peptidoglycan hydrolase CwlO-like protein